MDALKFDLRLKTVPVVLIDAASAQERQWSLVEMDGEARDSYLEAIRARTKPGSDPSRPVLTSFKGMQAELIARCLHTDAGELVTAARVQQFPASVQTALFKACNELNGLDAGAVDEAKND